MVVQVHGIGGIRDVSNNSQKGDMGSRTKTRARKKVDSNDSEHENQPIMGAVDHHVCIHPIHVYRCTFIIEGSITSVLTPLRY